MSSTASTRRDNETEKDTKGQEETRNMTSRSDSRLCVVTGASSGIGRATAIALVNANHPVLMLARRKDRLNDIVKELEAERKGHLVRAAVVDVTNQTQFASAIADAEKYFSTTTSLLVNNAGCMLLGNVVDQSPKEWQQMLNVNVTGVLNGIQIVLKGMIERKSGTVINVSSIAGFKAFENHAAYCGTKYAVHGITETVRMETAKHGLRHILISPGVVSTELLGHTTSSSIKKGYEDWKKQMGHPLQSCDVAKTIVFAYEMPQHVCLREIVVGPTFQAP